MLEMIKRISEKTPIKKKKKIRPAGVKARKKKRKAQRIARRINRRK